MWLLKQDRILTKINLSNKGWQGDTACLFCGDVESTNHLLYPFSKAIWSWIANHNGLYFNCENIEDLWLLDCCIPRKNKLLVKLVRAVTLWSIWLAKNKVSFENSPIPPLTSIGTNIISLASYWCKARNDETYIKLTLILPMDVYNLKYRSSLTLLLVLDTQEKNNSQGTGDAELGSGELDLSDYLIARMESDFDIPSDPNIASPSSDESYMDCTSASSDSVLS